MSAFWKKNHESDVEKSYPGGADMEVIIVELGLYDHITTVIQRHVNINRDINATKTCKCTILHYILLNVAILCEIKTGKKEYIN